MAKKDVQDQWVKDAKKLLKKLEWFKVFYEGSEMEVCSVCQGNNPEHRNIKHICESYIGHKKDCELQRLLKPMRKT